MNSLDVGRAQWRGEWVRVVWVAAFLVYVGLCLPAIGQRGYPPINAHWQGCAWLWVAAVPLTALMEERSKARTRWLAFYALATAAVDGLSWPNGVPKHFEPQEFAVEFLVFAVFHLLLAMILEEMTRLLIRVGETKAAQSLRFSKKTGIILVLIGGAMIPHGYWMFNGWRLANEGRENADEDWRSAAAVHYLWKDDEVRLPGNIFVSLHYDPKTGLENDGYRRQGWEEAYNARIAELMMVHGKPMWALPWIPSPEKLSDILTSAKFEEIGKFPYRLSPWVTLTKTPGLNIVTKERTWRGSGQARNIFLYREPAYPMVYFIRDGDDDLYAITMDGKELGEASRYVEVPCGCE